MAHKYNSKYSPGKQVSAAQYITEIICEKYAKKNNKELPIKFWNQEEWLKLYKFQLFKANALLKIYDESSIIQAITSKEGKYIYSLGSNKLDDIIKRQQAIIKIKNDNLKKTKNEPLCTHPKSPRKTFIKPNNMYKKLDKLDG